MRHDGEKETDIAVRKKNIFHVELKGIFTEVAKFYTNHYYSVYDRSICFSRAVGIGNVLKRLAFKATNTD
jgi:hypothetical protein